MRKLMLTLALLSMLIMSCTALTVVADEPAAEPAPKVTTYTYGGENGQFETDGDNSEGIWGYYTHWGTMATLESDLTCSSDGTNYWNGEDYLSINKSGLMHPGCSEPWSGTAVALTVEYDGFMDVSMVATRDAIAPNAGQFATDNNGTTAKIMVNTTSETPVAEVLVGDKLVTELEVQAIPVKAGDQVFLFIHHNNNCSFDAATYVTEFTLWEEKVTTHQFGGENGEFETDGDNSEGIWNYYTHWGTMATLESDLTCNPEGTNYWNGEEYLSINKSGLMHPGCSDPWSGTAISLNVEYEGYMDVKMVATRDAIAPNAGQFGTDNNGTTAKIIVNKTETPVAEILVGDKLVTELEVKNIEVRKGDEVFLFIHHNNNFAFDGATYVTTFTLTAADVPDPEPEVKDPKGPAPELECGETCACTAETCYCSNLCTCEKCAEFQNKLEGDKDSVNNIDDFRFIQGYANFTYVYGKVEEGIAGLKQYDHNSSTNWDTDNVIPWMGYRIDGLAHPGLEDGVAYMSGIGWTSTKDQVVDVYYDMIFESVAGNAGDGVEIFVYLNDKCLKTFELDAEYFEEDPLVLEYNSISMKEGDVIYLLVGPNESFAFDGLLTYVEISWLKGNEEVPSVSESASNSESEAPASSCGGSVSAISCTLLGTVVFAAACISLNRKKED